MAFTAYIVYNSKNILVGIYRTQAQAVAAAGKDASFTAYAQSVSLDEGTRLGVYFDTTDNLVKFEKPLSSDELLLSNRRRVKDGLRRLESLSQFALWASSEPDRGTIYAKRLENLARATNVDTNMTNNILYGQLLVEVNIPPEKWFYQFKLSDWTTHYPDNRLNPEWGAVRVSETLHDGPYTLTNLDNSLYDSRVSVASTIAGRADTREVIFSWIKYLREVP